MDVFAAPAHPYTAALLASVPRAHEGGHVRALSAGEIPSPIAPPPGCRFHPRCATAQARCREDRPALLPVAAGRQVACHFPLTA
jgi:peptide/nickel transport system ATP-binding protein